MSNCFSEESLTLKVRWFLVKWLINLCPSVVHWRPPQPLDWPLLDDGPITLSSIYQPSAPLAVLNDRREEVSVLFDSYLLSTISQQFDNYLLSTILQQFDNYLLSTILQQFSSNHCNTGIPHAFKWKVQLGLFLPILTFVTIFLNRQYSVFLNRQYSIFLNSQYSKILNRQYSIFLNRQYSIFPTTKAKWRKKSCISQAVGWVHLLLLIIRDKAARQVVSSDSTISFPSIYCPHNFSCFWCYRVCSMY